MPTLTEELQYDPAHMSATGTVQVPRGPDRKFSIRALDAADQMLYGGEVVSDVDETELPLVINVHPKERDDTPDTQPREAGDTGGMTQH